MHIVIVVFATAIVTTWVFKKKRSKYFHESGLSGRIKKNIAFKFNFFFLLEITYILFVVIWGLMVGAILRFAGSETR